MSINKPSEELLNRLRTRSGKLDEIGRFLKTKFGSAHMTAQLREYYSTTVGFYGWECDTLEDEFIGNIDEIMIYIRSVWIPRVFGDHFCKDCGDFSLFKTGTIFKKWCIDLNFGYGLVGHGNYYIKLQKAK